MYMYCSLDLFVSHAPVAINHTEKWHVGDEEQTTCFRAYPESLYRSRHTMYVRTYVHAHVPYESWCYSADHRGSFSDRVAIVMNISDDVII